LFSINIIKDVLL